MWYRVVSCSTLQLECSSLQIYYIHYKSTTFTTNLLPSLQILLHHLLHSLQILLHQLQVTTYVTTSYFNLLDLLRTIHSLQRHQRQIVRRSPGKRNNVRPEQRTKSLKNPLICKTLTTSCCILLHLLQIYYIYYI